MGDISEKSVEITQKIFQDMQGRVNSFIKRESHSPSKVHIVKNGTDWILYNRYTDMRVRNAIFKNGNGRFPKTLWIKKPSTTKKVVVKAKEWFLSAKIKWSKQSTSYNCAPQSFSMVIYELGLDIDQIKLAKMMGTGTKGTGHPGILACAKRLGLKAKFVNFDSLSVDEFKRIAEDPKRGIMFHFQVTNDGVAYDGKTVIYRSYRDGHYEAFFGINPILKEIRTGDPDRRIINYDFARVRNSAKATENKFKVGSVLIVER